MNDNQSSKPLSEDDFFTKKAVSSDIVQVSMPTFTKYLESGLVFPPEHISPTSKSANPRSYYTTADAMRISIMLYGSIRMDLIRSLLENEIHNSRTKKDKTIDFFVKSSFKIIKQNIIDSVNHPVNLNSYLYEHNESSS